MDKIILHIPDNFRGKYNGSHIRWKDHIGQDFPIEYQNTKYIITVKDVVDGTLTLSCKDKSVIITIAMMGNKVKDQKLLGYCDAGKLLYLVDDNVFLGDTGWNCLIKYKYAIGQHIKNDIQDFIIKDRKVTSDKHTHHLKKYLIHCNTCTGDSWVTEASIGNRCRCQCCNNTLVISGINDIATTHPWAVKYFLNKKDATKYHSGTWFSADMICPICGHIYKNKSIRSLFMNANGLNCCEYSYKSYPERFVHNLFEQLKVEFIAQAHLGENNNFRYDFYLPNYSCIIEVHGIQHYKSSFINTTYDEVHTNDINKYELAKPLVNHYIVLDCRHSYASWIKNAILTSDLPNILSFTEPIIDWKKCDQLSRTNIERDICWEYTTNLLATTHSIASQFKLCLRTVSAVLKSGTKLGLCDYDPQSLREKMHMQKVRPIGIYKNRELVHVCSSYAEATSYLRSVGLTIGDTAVMHRLGRNHPHINDEYSISRIYSVTNYAEYIEYMSNPERHYIESRGA